MTTTVCTCTWYCRGAHQLPANRHCRISDPLPAASPSLPAARLACDAAIRTALGLTLRAGRTADAGDVARAEHAEQDVAVALDALTEVASQTPVAPSGHLSDMRQIYDAEHVA